MFSTPPIFSLCPYSCSDPGRYSQEGTNVCLNELHPRRPRTVGQLSAVWFYFKPITGEHVHSSQPSAAAEARQAEKYSPRWSRRPFPRQTQQGLQTTCQRGPPGQPPRPHTCCKQIKVISHRASAVLRSGGEGKPGSRRAHRGTAGEQTQGRATRQRASARRAPTSGPGSEQDRGLAGRGEQADGAEPAAGGAGRMAERLPPRPKGARTAQAAARRSSSPGPLRFC